MSIAATPAAPYYAVIFTSLRRPPASNNRGQAHDGGDGGADNGYGAMAAIMLASAARQPGYLGVESARDALGITVSYWTDLDAIAAWKRDTDHRLAQRLGRQDWYAAYKVRICRVERDYRFDDASAAQGAGARCT